MLRPVDRGPGPGDKNDWNITSNDVNYTRRAYGDSMLMILTFSFLSVFCVLSSTYIGFEFYPELIVGDHDWLGTT